MSRSRKSVAEILNSGEFVGPLPQGVHCRPCYGAKRDPSDCLCGEPKSVRRILRDAGLSMSGQKRKLVAKAIDDALFSLWQAAFEREGGEYAACILASVIARDPTYEPELWALYTLRRHRAAVTAVLRSLQ